jgi:CRP-like cAMP-binding protein
MQTDKALVIRQIPPFDGLQSAELGFLGNILHKASIPAGTLLFREGDPGDRFYLIVDGEVEVVKAFGTPDERLRAVR